MSKQFLKPVALAISISLIVAGCGSSGNDATNTAAPASSTAAASTVATPMASTTVAPTPGTAASTANADPFNIALIDPSLDACNDFNGFVNAKWDKANPIPADQSRWGAFGKLREKSLDDQHQLVQAADKDADSAKAGSNEQKIGWFWRSGMNTDAINKAGFNPIKPDLASIAALKRPKDIANWMDKAFAKGDSHIFYFGSTADFRDAKTQIGGTFQSGLGLPTPDYYTEVGHKDTRDAYVKHIAKMFELTGVPAADASKKAGKILAFETELAKHSLSRIELRNPKNQFHFVTLAEANKITPHFNWENFLKAQDVNGQKGFSMGQPKFFTQFDKMLAHTPVSTWQDYLAYHTIDGAAPYLSQEFQDASFDFHGKTLNGQPEQKARWKRVLGVVNSGMGMALGELYVAKYFPPQAKARAETLVTNVRDALKARIENLAWMSDATKAKAVDKWNKFLPKIGYPDKFRSWDGLKVTPDNFYANAEAAQKFNHDYDIAKIGQPSDRHEWGMTPQTVNAYYNPTDNTINFPAAILQPPFFYANGDDAINYGGIGAVIGHESSHGFDDQGSQFDGAGNLNNWWTKVDRKKFDARTQKLVDQFNTYVPLKDHPKDHVKGELTLGENIADLGGLNVAYDALQTALKNHPAEAGKKIDGYTEDQRFFLSWARVWAGNIREKHQLVLLNTDPHAPAKFRAMAAPSNMPAFAQAFQCKAGDKMVRPADKQVNIW